MTIAIWSKSITDFAVFRLDTSELIMTWNTGARLIKGYSASEIIGRHYELFFTPEDRADGRPEKALVVARTSGRYEDEGWRVRKDGSRFWASAVIDQIVDESGQLVGFAKVTRDLTEKRAVYEALRQRDRNFRLLLESVHHHAIYTVDLEGLITSWDAGAERIKGYSNDRDFRVRVSRNFTRLRIRLPASLSRRSKLRGHADDLRRKVGESARMEAGFGPMSSSSQ